MRATIDELGGVIYTSSSCLAESEEDVPVEVIDCVVAFMGEDRRWRLTSVEFAEFLVGKLSAEKAVTLSVDEMRRVLRQIALAVWRDRLQVDAGHWTWEDGEPGTVSPAGPLSVDRARRLQEVVGLVRDALDSMGARWHVDRDVHAADDADGVYLEMVTRRHHHEGPLSERWDPLSWSLARLLVAYLAYFGEVVVATWEVRMALWGLARERALRNTRDGR